MGIGLAFVPNAGHGYVATNDLCRPAQDAVDARLVTIAMTLEPREYALIRTNR
ncbi:MAG: hypothetical protein WA609_15600 [Terriglobales bacterium]